MTHTNQTIRCKKCDFAFSVSEVTASAVCPACGNECTVTVAETPRIVQETRKHPVKRYPHILVWSVLVQCCILAGALLFVAKTLRSPEVFVQRNVPVALIQEETCKPATPILETVQVTETIQPLENFVPDETPQPEITMGNWKPETPVETLQNEVYVQPEPLPEPKLTLFDADELLKNAVEKTYTAPEEAWNDAVAAVKIYQELRSEMPPNIYYILGNICAGLNWGENVMEGIPAVNLFAVSSDGLLLVAQLQDQRIVVKNLEKSSEIELSGQVPSPYIRFLISPDKHWIIGGQSSGTVRIWDMSQSNPAAAELREKIPNFTDIQISPDGHYLAAAAANSNRLRSDTFSTPFQLVSFQTRPNRNEASSETASDALEQVYVWNLRNLDTGLIPAAMTVPVGMDSAIQGLRFSPDSHKLALGSSNGTVRICTVSEESISDMKVFLGHRAAVTQIDFLPSGDYLATGSQDNTIRLWKLTENQLAPESVVLDGHIGWISALAISDDGKYLYSGSYDETVRCWKTDDALSRSAYGRAEDIGEQILLDVPAGTIEQILPTTDGKLIVRGSAGVLSIMNGIDTAGVSRPCVTFRNKTLPITSCAAAKHLLFCYSNNQSPANSGIRLWHLDSEGLLNSKP